MDITTTQLIDVFLLPPGGPLMLGVIGLLLLRLGIGRKLVSLSVLLLWVFSMPATEHLLMSSLETYAALSEEEIQVRDAEAIVLLGSRRYLDAPEYGRDSAGPSMLMRMRYAAWLAGKTGLPIIPSGGIVDNDGEAEARIYAHILREEYGLEVEQIESRSRNTWENARYTAQLMKKLGIERIFLVTDAGHMRRALYAFEHNGIQPVPAPTAFAHRADRRYTWFDFMPHADAMKYSAYALHEYLGLLWYRLR